MHGIAAFGRAKRKCAGTRRRRSRRSIPVPCSSNLICRVSSSVERSLPKPQRRVRFPYPAPKRDAIHSDGISFWSTDSAMNLWFDRPAILCEAQRLRIAQTVFVCLTEQLPGRHSASFAGGVFPHILNCLLIHSVHTTQREEPSIRMALLFGILTPASAQFEPDKHAPNQSGWLGACIFSAKNAYFFFALIAACAAARRAMGTRNGLHET